MWAQNRGRALTGPPLQRRNWGVKVEQAFRCAACRQVFAPQDMEVDHILPVAQGGTDDRDNLQALCVACHERKTYADLGWRCRETIGTDGFPADGGEAK